MTSRASHSLIGLAALLVLGGVVVFGIWTLGTPAESSVRARPPANASLSDAVLRDDAMAIRAALASGADVNAPIATDKPGREGMTPLIHAAFEGKAETLKTLIDARGKTEARTEDGRTALMYAAGWGDAAKVKMLLDAGARTDARASNGWTALMWACTRGEPASVKALVAAGGDVNAANKWRQTALMSAAAAGSVEKISLLLEAGASAATIDMDGNTPLAAAASNDAPPAVLEALVKAGTPIDAADADGVTPLMKAAERGDLAQIQTLLRLGSDASRKDKANGWTAKDWAAKRDDEKGRAVVQSLERK